MPTRKRRGCPGHLVSSRQYGQGTVIIGLGPNFSLKAADRLDVVVEDRRASLDNHSDGR